MGTQEVDPEKLAAVEELTRRLLVSFIDELRELGFPTQHLDALRSDLGAGEIGACELAARVVARCRHWEGLLG